jgi:uncharacterized protein DUF732
MRDRETIDSELRQLAAMRRAIREQGGQPSSRQADELLDERLGHRPEAPQTEVVVDTRAWHDETHAMPPYRRKGPLRQGALRRFGPLAALPLSLIAVAAAALVVIFAVHKPDPEAQSAQPPAAQPAQPPAAQPPVVPPSGVRANPAAPKALAPPVGIVDMAFIGALTQEGVPVPSQEYVMTHGHAVCDFLAHQPNFQDAVRFVQGSSIWDADQSAEFATGAIVSYCPQYETATPDQQALQNALSAMQAIQGDLQGIQGDLHGIRDHLQGIPGQP